MRRLLPLIRVAVLLVLILTAFAGVLFPAVLWGIAQAAFPERANGSFVRHDDRIVGSRLIAQAFEGDGYFHPRPSAAGTGYDASRSGGSNLGPTNERLLQEVRARLAEYRANNGLSDDARVPVDAVTTSGSGLDPHISIANAQLQLPRVARTRGIDPDNVRTLIAEYTESPDLGVFGEQRINVLLLNLALDSIVAAGARARR